MIKASHHSYPVLSVRGSPDVLRLGFVPLVHAAPLIAAQEHDLFRRHGLRVRLSREVGWATVREKLLAGELDASQALAPMPLAMTLGLNSARGDCVCALILNLHGNVIVLSRRRWSETRGRAETLAAIPPPEPMTFGIVYPHSAQADIMRRWLGDAGLVPERDYRLVVVPPQQMVNHLRAGHLDGFCSGEPWGSLAVRAGVGVIAALSADLAPGHPEKVLMVRSAFAEHRAGQHAALVAALHEACRWCADPAHHPELIRMLASRQHLGLPVEVIRPAITGHFDLGTGNSVVHPCALVFHRGDSNQPTLERARIIARQLGHPVTDELLSQVFRPEILRSATASNPIPKTEHEHPSALAAAV